jgi:putative redox protein
MAIKLKTTVKMGLSAQSETHARMRIAARDVQSVIDEPEARGGTNQGLTPTETLMSALMGCTNVISARIAHKMGITLDGMEISLSADFNRLGTMLEEEIEHPFTDIVMEISVATDADAAQLAALQSDLAKFCPIAKVIRGSGVTITENWTVQPL